MRLKIAPPKPKVYARASESERVRYYSDAPMYSVLPKHRVKPAKDIAPKLITEFRESLSSALSASEPFARHVAFYRWHESC